MDHSKFFASVRNTVLSGHLADSQVAGLEALLAACTASAVSDLRHIAYICATPMIETGGSYIPITENLN